MASKWFDNLNLKKPETYLGFLADHHNPFNREAWGSSYEGREVLENATNAIKKAGSKTKTALLAAAGVAGVAYMLSGLRADKKYDPSNDFTDVTLPTPTPILMNPNAPVGPAPGYRENQWQDYVAAGRGGVVRRAGAETPRMSAVPEESVQDMGVPRAV